MQDRNYSERTPDITDDQMPGEGLLSDSTQQFLRKKIMAQPAGWYLTNPKADRVLYWDGNKFTGHEEPRTPNSVLFDFEASTEPETPASPAFPSFAGGGYVPTSEPETPTANAAPVNPFAPPAFKAPAAAPTTQPGPPTHAPKPVRLNKNGKKKRHPLTIIGAILAILVVGFLKVGGLQSFQDAKSQNDGTFLSLPTATDSATQKAKASQYDKLAVESLRKDYPGVYNNVPAGAIVNSAHKVCTVLATGKSISAIANQFTDSTKDITNGPEAAGDLLATSIVAYCPTYTADLKAFIKNNQ